jgi:hypothetical protein
MNRTEYAFIQAEKNALVQLITDAPANAVISRNSLQARLDKVESLLNSCSLQDLPFEGRITFRGKPVLDSEGIETVFAATIINGFSEMIAAKASSYQGRLSGSGKIANRDAYRMNITGTTAGSFGFVFEECLPDQQTTQGIHSPVESAFIDCLELFKALQNGHEEELANAVDQTDERVLAMVRKFLNDLIANETVCAVESSQYNFGFNSTSEIQQSVKKIAADNIREWEETVIGEFIGVLVSERKFEFKPKTDEASPLKGKIPGDVIDLEEIGRNLYQKIYEIQLRGKRVGTGPVRYTLSHYHPVE